ASPDWTSNVSTRSCAWIDRWIRSSAPSRLKPRMITRDLRLSISPPIVRVLDRCNASAPERKLLPALLDVVIHCPFSEIGRTLLPPLCLIKVNGPGGLPAKNRERRIRTRLCHPQRSDHTTTRYRIDGQGGVSDGEPCSALIAAAKAVTPGRKYSRPPRGDAFRHARPGGLSRLQSWKPRVLGPAPRPPAQIAIGHQHGHHPFAGNRCRVPPSIHCRLDHHVSLRPDRDSVEFGR